MKARYSILLIYLHQLIGKSYAKKECSEDSHCESVYGTTESLCVEGFCSNPYVKGCLQSLPTFDKHLPWNNDGLRVCNSEDKDISLRGVVCKEQNERVNYQEIRLSPGNWESAIFNAWIIQIILSEMVGVPVTIETGTNSLNSFYSTDVGFAYPLAAYPFEALERANALGGNCTKDTSEPCSHMMTEVWDGQNENILIFNDKDEVEPGEGIGYSGRNGFYITSSTARKYPELKSYYGLQGEKYREKLASIFKRPQTWKEYCDLQIDNTCIETDEVAQRPPNDAEEGAKYFLEGYYNGYFHATNENRCDINPNCTGHVVATPCGWSFYTEQQLYWNEIYLQSSGPETPNRAYTYGQILDIMEASKFNESDIIVTWWEPEPRINEYNLTLVQLPRAEFTCLENRVNERCHDELDVRRGTKEGSCDYVSSVLQKVIAASLREETYNDDEAVRSPAYDFLKSFSFRTRDMDTILDEWFSRGVDTSGYDARLTVCNWVQANAEDYIQRFIPEGYPRLFESSEFETPLTWTAFSASILVTCSIFFTVGFSKRYGHTRALKFAQIKFLFLTLVGYTLWIIGAMLISLEPTKYICTSAAWFVNIGYTFAFVPLLVKVAAIVKVSNHSRRMMRIKIDISTMYARVALAVAFVIIYMIFWTVIDSPTVQSDLYLKDGGTVEIVEKCGSENDAWYVASFLWRFCLLLIGAFLSVQSRKIAKQFNEAAVIAILCYSRFTFFVMLVILRYLDLDASVEASSESLLYSFDAFSSIVIYFIPKFFEAHKNHVDSIRREQRRLSSIDASRRVTDVGLGEEEDTTPNRPVFMFTDNPDSISAINDSRASFHPDSSEENCEANAANDYSINGTASTNGVNTESEAMPAIAEVEDVHTS